MPKDNSADALAQLNQNQQAEINRLKDKVKELEKDNKAQRDKIRDLKAETERDDVLVLEKEQKTEYEALKALGTAKDIKARLDKAEAAETELQTLRRQQILAEAAEVLGWNVEALTNIAPADLSIQIDEETVDGEKKRMPRVEVDGKKTALADHAKDNWASLLPALEAEAESSKKTPTWPRQTPKDPAPKPVTVQTIKEAKQTNRTYAPL